VGAWAGSGRNWLRHVTNPLVSGMQLGKRHQLSEAMRAAGNRRAAYVSGSPMASSLQEMRLCPSITWAASIPNCFRTSVAFACRSW
jgi:hypothetical protein